MQTYKTMHSMNLNLKYDLKFSKFLYKFTEKFKIIKKHELIIMQRNIYYFDTSLSLNFHLLLTIDMICWQI